MTAGSGLASAVSLLPKLTARNTLRGGADGVSPIRIQRRASTDVADLLPLLSEDGLTKPFNVDSSFRLVAGLGDAQLLFVPTTGTRHEVREGTNALPDAALHPTHKVTRTMAVAPKTNIASIVGAGGIVTVTTTTPHLLAAGVTVDIAGTAGFNTVSPVAVTVVSPTVFTYAAATVGSETVGTAQHHVPGNSLEQGSAIIGLCVGQTPNAIQATGVCGIGIGASTVVDPRNDSAGIAGFAEITAPGSTNGAEAVYGAARRLISTAFAVGGEIQVQDYAADGGFSTAGFSKAYGLTLNAGGDPTSFNIGVGLLLARNGAAMHAGIACPAFATAGDGNGPCIDYFAGDWGRSHTSVYVGGSHDVGGVVIDDLSGALLVGVAQRSGDNLGSLAVIRDSVGSTSAATLWVGSQNAALIAQVPITSIVGNGTTVTVTTSAAHQLSTGLPALISGTTAFNGTFTVAVVDATHFTYSSAVVGSESAGQVTNQRAKAHFAQLTNFSGRHRWWIAGVPGDHMVGSQPGDGGWIVFQPNTKAVLGGFNGGGASRAPVFTFTYDGKGSLFGATPITRPTVTGSHASGAAFTSLLAALVALGVVNDTTTA